MARLKTTDALAINVVLADARRRADPRNRRGQAKPGDYTIDEKTHQVPHRSTKVPEQIPFDP
jgi:hypothetical protein